MSTTTAEGTPLVAVTLVSIARLNGLACGDYGAVNSSLVQTGLVRDEDDEPHLQKKCNNRRSDGEHRRTEVPE